LVDLANRVEHLCRMARPESIHSRHFKINSSPMLNPLQTEFLGGTGNEIESRGALSSNQLLSAITMVAEVDKAANIEFPTHPRVMRHGAGFNLANVGHNRRAIHLYLGHPNVQHTVQYTKLVVRPAQEFFKN
jgi:integrase